MKTQAEAIIEAFEILGGERSIKEIEQWVVNRYGARWKDTGTQMADMVPIDMGGNQSPLVPSEFRVLERVARGKYKLKINLNKENQ